VFEAMEDGKLGAEIAAGDLIGPAVAEVVVDPASLEPLAADASLTPSAAPVAGDALVLNLADLLPDADGAVVMLTDDVLPVNLVTDQPLAGSGVVGEPASAGGFDVEGLHFYSFANGLTLYSDADIVIVSDPLGA
jgi:hypothetical protein